MLTWIDGDVANICLKHTCLLSLIQIRKLHSLWKYGNLYLPHFLCATQLDSHIRITWHWLKAGMIWEVLTCFSGNVHWPQLAGNTWHECLTPGGLAHRKWKGSTWENSGRRTWCQQQTRVKLMNNKQKKEKKPCFAVIFYFFPLLSAWNEVPSQEGRMGFKEWIACWWMPWLS